MKDLTNLRFDRLVVLGRAPDRHYQPRNRSSTRRVRYWQCLCDCGRTIEAQTGDLTRAERNTRSCGCLARDLLRSRCVTHERSKTAEYRIWTGMKNRCTNPRVQGYPNYGGRGIRVCERWSKSFESFLADVGLRPSPLHSLDRYPNQDGNYEPGNVRWATMKEQCRNLKRNRVVVVGGSRMAVVEAAERFGIRGDTIIKRLLRGYSDEAAVLTPVKRRSA